MQVSKIKEGLPESEAYSPMKRLVRKRTVRAVIIREENPILEISRPSGPYAFFLTLLLQTVYLFGPRFLKLSAQPGSLY